MDNPTVFLYLLVKKELSKETHLVLSRHPCSAKISSVMVKLCGGVAALQTHVVTSDVQVMSKLHRIISIYCRNGYFISRNNTFEENSLDQLIGYGPLGYELRRNFINEW